MSRGKVPCYDVVDLGTLGGRESSASAVNNRGQIVGSADLSDILSHAFLWEDGAMRDLDTLGAARSLARSINELGQVVGCVQSSRGAYLPCLWDKGVIRLLDGEGGPDGNASDINEVGQIVGWRDRTPDRVRGGPELAILWQGSRSIELCTAKRFGRDAYTRFGSSAWGINGAGQIVGKTPGGPAFLWHEGEFTLFELVRGETATATAINEVGQVVGGGYIDDLRVHAFLWERGRIRKLGSLGGPEATPNDINILGDIVGGSFTAKCDEGGEPIEYHGFLWHNDLLMDLNHLIPKGTGWMIRSAEGINDAGWIVGTGVRDGVTRAVLLTPRS